MKSTINSVCRRGKWGFQNEKGHIIIPCKYDEVGYFNGIGYAVPVRQKDTWWFITQKNKVASHFTYDKICPYYWRMYLVQRDGLWGFVNDFGQEVVTCQFEDVVLIDDESRLVFRMVETPVCRNGKWGLINDKGQLVLPCEYDGIRDIHNGRVEIKTGNKWKWVSFD